MTDSYIALDLETTGLEPKKKKNNGDRSSKSRAWTDHRPFRNSGKSKTAADRKGRGINRHYR